MGRLIAIGDIHGEIRKLNKFLEKLEVKSDDALVIKTNLFRHKCPVLAL